MNTVTETTDRVERNIVINAPRERVWRALSDAEQFGAWFGANLKGQRFAPSERIRGLMTITGMEHMWFDVIVERVEPQTVFSYRWHPYAVDPKADYSKEPRTLVVFTLKDAPNKSTLLTVEESGFDDIPPDRRVEAFPRHKEGWRIQLDNVARYAST